MQLPFYMFSTLMSLEDRLRLKLKTFMYGYTSDVHIITNYNVKYRDGIKAEETRLGCLVHILL